MSGGTRAERRHPAAPSGANTPMGGGMTGCRGAG